MELKQGMSGVLLKFFTLLIVPYGIETCLSAELISISFLLIVPYGIET